MKNQKSIHSTSSGQEIKNQRSSKKIDQIFSRIRLEEKVGIKYFVPEKFIRPFFVLILLPVLLFLVLSSEFFVAPANAAVGINRTINFQGKVVNKVGETNITNGNYSFTFKFFDAASAGTQLPSGAAWTETKTLTVTDGIFRTALGDSTVIPSALDFNADNIYLDMTFNSETFTTRIRMTAVPYAFNAEKVAGLTVTSTTGTLTIPNAKTISFADAFTTSGAFPLTLTQTASTNVTLPTTGTLVARDSTDTLTNKTIGSTGLTFSGASTDIDTAAAEGLVLQGRAASSFSTTAGTITFQAAGSGTIGTVQIGAGGAGSTTPDFLGLDVKSDTGDPAGGFEGAMYYNTFDNKFRCYQGAAWADCVGGGGAPAWSSITDPTGALTLNHGTNLTTFNFTNATTTGFLNNFNSLTSGTGFSIASSATAFTGALQDITLSGSNAANTGSLLTLTNSGTLNTNTSLYLKHYATGTNNLAFRVDDEASDTTPFVIDGAGNVGIGNAAPGSKLTIDETITNTGSTQDINLTLGADADVDTISGLNVDVTSANTGDADLLYGIHINNLTSPDSIVQETALKFGTGWDYDIQFNDTTPVIRLGATDNTGILQINDSASTPNNLLEIKDLSTNFGAAVESGAFIDRNSYFGEEFSRERATVTADGNLNWGDMLSWSTDETATTGDCSFLIGDDLPNGIGAMILDDAGSVCNMYLGTTVTNDLNLILDADNLPVILMKLRPSAVGASDDFWVGLQDQTQLQTNDEPDQGIFFTNDNGTEWTGVVKTADGTRTAVACSGATVSTTQYALLKIEVISTSDVRFYVDTDVSNGVSYMSCGSATTSANIPTAGLGSMLKISSTTISRLLLIDFFRVWQDDSAPNGLEFASNEPLEIENSETAPYDSRVALMELMADFGAAEADGVDVYNTERLVAGLEIVTPKVTTDKLRVNTISSATEKDITIQLGSDGKFIVKGEGESGKGEVITFDNMGNAYFAGTITADKIKANQIEGLDVIESGIRDQELRIKDLENLFTASQSAAASPSADVIPSASSGQVLSETKDLDSSPSAQNDNNILAISGLTVEQSATVSADLRVKGDGLVEGILSVIDTLMAKNLIVSGVADFFSNVVFRGDVEFVGRPTFNKDTAGTVVVKKDTQEIEVKFDREYEKAPVVNANITFDEKNQELGIMNQEELESQVFSNDIRYIVTKRSKSGFTIKLNKQVSFDLPFSWTALTVNGLATQTRDGPE